jgi:hypothetical protein
MMASGKSAKKQRRALPVVHQREGLPWLTISAVAVIVALAAVIFVVVFNAKQDKNQAAAAEQAIEDQLKPWEPTTENPDPSTAIPDIYVGDEAQYKVGLHVEPPTRVAYDRYPPVGGPHDATWAACNGVVYAVAVRNENMVHTLEHGAIWITYNPDTIAAGDLDILKALVTGKQYITLSPYPSLSSKISLQAWRHQLMLDSASDARVREFITALQRNPNTTPEVNGTCEQPTFDVENPPAFDPSTPGPDAVQLDGTGGTSGAVATASSEDLSTMDETTGTESAGTEPTDTVSVTPTEEGSTAAGTTAPGSTDSATAAATTTG